MGEHPGRPVGHREDHPLRRVGVSVADRGRGEELRRHPIPVGKGSAPLRHLHPLRPGRHDGGREGCGTRWLYGRSRAGGRVHRLGHRRPADDRGNACALHAGRPAQDLAVLRAWVDHQHDRRTGVDPLRVQGAESRHRERVLDRQPQHGRGGPPHRIRRCRHHGGRRVRGDRVAARHRRVLRVAGAVHAQRRPGDGEPAVGLGPRRLRAGGGRGRPRPRNTSMRRRAAHGCTASSRATA